MADRSVVYRLIADTSQYKREMASAGQVTERAGSQMEGTGKKSALVSSEMAKAGAVAAGAFAGKVIMAAADFDQSMSNIQAATHETAENMDALREATFARQKDLGIIPADAQLTPRPDEITSWDDMPEEMKPILARQMEVYAGFLEHTDHHVGRVIDAIDELGVLDNTIIYYIVGDNGASAEGTMDGAFNEMADDRFNWMDVESNGLVQMGVQDNNVFYQGYADYLGVVPEGMVLGVSTSETADGMPGITFVAAVKYDLYNETLNLTMIAGQNPFAEGETQLQLIRCPGP